MPTYVCDECDTELPTQRGLRIHMSRKHGVADTPPSVPNPTKGTPISLDEARQKFYETIGKAKISPVANMALTPSALKYADPSIRLSAEEASSIDSAARELAAEYGGDSALSIAKYLPILNGLFVVVPIVLDKIEKIQYYKALEATGGLGKREPAKSAAPAPGAPTLTRKDLQPDLDVPE